MILSCCFSFFSIIISFLSTIRGIFTVLNIFVLSRLLFISQCSIFWIVFNISLSRHSTFFYEFTTITTTFWVIWQFSLDLQFILNIQRLLLLWWVRVNCPSLTSCFNCMHKLLLLILLLCFTLIHFLLDWWLFLPSWYNLTATWHKLTKNITIWRWGNLL